MPKLGVSMTSGVVSEWLAADGEPVEKGQPVLIVSSDKTDAEIEAPHAGVLTVVVEEGEEVDVGTLLAEIKPT